MGISVHRAGVRKKDRLVKIIKRTSLILNAIGFPEYNSGKSKRTCSDHAKIGLLIIRQHLGISYESFSLLLPSLGGVMRIARITHVPEQSTLRKFSRRLDPNILSKIFCYVAMTVCKENTIAAIDSTGFSCSNAPRHFVKRMRESANFE